jgi:hypothetical protein
MEIAAVQREQVKVVREEIKRADPQSEEKKEIKAKEDDKELVAKEERNREETGFSAVA